MSSDKEPIYKNNDALKPIEKLNAEAEEALNDKERTASTEKDINEALIAAGGISTGGVIGFAGLYYAGITGLSAAGMTSALAAAGGLIGGGMAAGIAVLAAPAVLLGVGGYAWAAQRNKRLLIKKKDELLASIRDKHTKIEAEIEAYPSVKAESERLDYLKRLNILIVAAIEDLEADVEYHGQKK